jgi:hypothetical protein
MLSQWDVPIKGVLELMPEMQRTDGLTCSNFSDCLTLKMETLRSFETSVINRSRPQRDPPESSNFPLAIYCKDSKQEVQQRSPMLVQRLSSIRGCSLPAPSHPVA